MPIRKISRAVLISLSSQRTGGLEAVLFDVAAGLRKLGLVVELWDVFGKGVEEDWCGVVVRHLRPKRQPSSWLWGRGGWRKGVASLICSSFGGSGADLLIIGHADLLPLMDSMRDFSKFKVWCWAYGIELWGGRVSRFREHLNRMNRIVAISKFTRREILRHGILGPVDIVAPCVNIHRFTPLTDATEVRQDEVLICGRMSRSERYKGHDILFEALPLAEKKLGRKLRLRVVGEGDDRKRLERRTWDCGIGDRVFFEGRLSEEKLIDAYRRCGVFCMPSVVVERPSGLWSGEGFGIVYIEAAACGRPVLASLDGGAPETIVNGETGLLVNPRSADDVADGIAKILGNSERANEMGALGRLLVEKRFGWDGFVVSLKQLLEE